MLLRYARYYIDEGEQKQKRTLTKAYGILFKIELHGTVSELSLHVAAGIHISRGSTVKPHTLGDS